MNICIVGLGYVGLALSTLLAQKNNVIALDIEKDKVIMVNKRICPIQDEYIENYFKSKHLNLMATLDYKLAIKNANIVFICAPTDYDETTKCLDTRIVDDVIHKILEINTNVIIVIKSTVPIGFTEEMQFKYNYKDIIFSPEFLREGTALYDNLYPNRIIVGAKTKSAKKVGQLLKSITLKKRVAIKFMNSKDAEAVKLFSNAYLALRISFFNELDTFAEINKLDTKNIIEGVCLDKRIGNYYNNPSFGYGGYCLFKDPKQLLYQYKKVPQNLINSIVNSNETRVSYIINNILSSDKKIIGIYRLNIKNNSNDIRSSIMDKIIDGLKLKEKNLIIYEPLLKQTEYKGFQVINDLNKFIEKSDIIITNRMDKNIENCQKEIYTRDLYNIN